MSKWFRWYEGTSEDGKFRVAARNASVTVRDVIALWAFVLEDASSDKHRGVCTRDEDFMASILDFEDGVAEKILSAMEDLGMISVGHGAITIINWGKRQFETDTKDPTNADRQKRWRDNHKTEGKRKRNGDVTETKLPDTDTDTDTEKKIVRSKKPDDPEFSEWYAVYPKHEARGSAEKAYRAARKSTEAAVLLEGAKKAAARYAGSDPQFIPLPATWLNGKRWLDEVPKHPSKPLTRAQELYREGII